MANNATPAADDAKPVQKLMGTRVRERRTALRLTQKQLADRMQAEGFNYLQSTVTKVEAGGRPSGPDEIAALARVLNASPGELLASATDPVPEEVAEVIEYIRSTSAALLTTRREIRDLESFAQIQQWSLDRRLSHGRELLERVAGAAETRLREAVAEGEAALRAAS